MEPTIVSSLGLSGDIAEWATKSDISTIRSALEVGYTAWKNFHKPPTILMKADSKNASSSKRGIDGEKHVETILASNFAVENVAKEARSGDLTLYIKHKKILVEVKNYTQAVPYSQVEKFVRDLSANGADAGLFISINTSISKTPDFTIKYEYADTKIIPVVYLVSNESAPILAAVGFLEKLLSSPLQNYSCVSRDMGDKIQRAVDAVDYVSKSKHELLENLSEVNSAISKTISRITVSESRLRESLSDIQNELCYKSMEHNGMSEELTRVLAEKKYLEITRTNVMKVFNKMSEKLHRQNITQPVWDITARKIINKVTGFYFNLLQTKVEICIPTKSVSAEKIIEAVNKFSDKIKISTDLLIELDPITYDYIDSII